MSGDAIAQGLRTAVEEDGSLPPGINGMPDYEDWRILVRPELRATKRSETVAHETSEMNGPERLEEAFHEAFHDRVADVELVERWRLLAAIRESGFALDTLRLRWLFSSREQLARRLAQVLPGLTVTGWIWEQEQWRETSAGLVVPDWLAKVEDAARAEAYYNGPSIKLEQNGVLAHAWRLHSLPNEAIVICEVEGRKLSELAASRPIDP